MNNRRMIPLVVYVAALVLVFSWVSSLAVPKTNAIPYSEVVELFFVLELCRDRAVAYQWVQLGGADFLSGMSKNLTKIG